VTLFDVPELQTADQFNASAALIDTSGSFAVRPDRLIGEAAAQALQLSLFGPCRLLDRAQESSCQSTAVVAVNVFTDSTPRIAARAPKSVGLPV